MSCRTHFTFAQSESVAKTYNKSHKSAAACEKEELELEQVYHQISCVQNLEMC